MTATFPPKYDRRRLTIAHAQTLASARGGEFLSTEYRTALTKYRWKCGCGHEWDATYNSIQRGSWCPECGKRRISAALSFTHAQVNEIAARYGGELVDAEYRGSGVYHRFRCANGHVFQQMPERINASSPLKRRWCQKCSMTLNLSEEICRAIIETAIGRPFPSTFPGEWLQNSRGRKMQLDGYCAEQRLAFEYQGEQHYEKVGKFKKSLEQRIEDDAEKARLCREHGIRLVCIPHFPTQSLSMAQLIEHVASAFTAAGLDLPAADADRVEDLIALEISQPMTELQELAKSRGGEILSTAYIGAHAKYLWRCAAGHEWQAGAAAVKSGSWCGVCAGVAPLTIEQMHAYAESRGGKCLSTVYHNAKVNLIWECSCGHQWEAMPVNIFYKKGWCPSCSGGAQTKFKSAAAALADLLTAKGFRLISEYLGSMDPITIACPAGHTTRFSQAAAVKHRLKKNLLHCRDCAAE